MICLNGIYFDNIRVAKVVHRDYTEMEYSVCGEYPIGYSEWFDVNINGEDLGLELSESEAKRWLDDTLGRWL